MKKFILLFLVGCIFSFDAAAQPQPTETKTETKPAAKAANPADVGSMDAIMRAVYDVISGDAGQKRDWDRFRTLFHKDARMIPAGKNKEGVASARAFTPEEYIARSAPLMEKDGFHEREIARRAEVYGNIAHVFSTYAAYKKSDDKQPFLRGINSFQLLNDGTRWWVLTIYWQAETPDNPIPKDYLKSKS